jgi:AmmeMemoRadiSam system protein B
MFYPADANQLLQLVQSFLEAIHPDNQRAPKAIIAPHAGYIYSGPIAASVYARIAKSRGIIKRVVLLGPAHRVPFAGLAAPSNDVFRSPLGDIPLDVETIKNLTKLPQVRIFDEAHTLEHSLEVQLPFLQETLDDFMLIPLVVGDATADEVSEVLEAIWGGEETLIVISSDLSHYHDYETARKLDTATSAAIESLQPEKIRYENACGRTPVNGLLKQAKKLGLRARTIDLRSSGDTAGPRDQVVGYGAYVIE